MKKNMLKILKKKKNSKKWNFGKKLDFESPLAFVHKLRYPISSNFHFLSVSIQALYQKLWSFKVFFP